MNHPHEPDLAAPADRTVAEATAIPPDEVADDPRAYLAWLRDPERRARRHRPRPRIIPLPPEPSNTQLAQVRDPAYLTAQTKLRALPDLGAALLEAARAQLDPDTPYEDLVIHAAAAPGAPERNGTARNDPEQPATPACTTGGEQ